MKESDHLSRRRFMQVSSAMIAGGVATAASGKPEGLEDAGDKPEKVIQRYRTLGRTGFKASDIGYGTGPVSDPNLIRYAVDKGINYFDTAEGYARGLSERMIGEALAHIDRKKVFITTKVGVSENDDKASILRRFGKCQERLKTDYVDAFFMHGVPRIGDLDNKAFHAACAELKSQGRLKHIGISCHEPAKGDRMEDICIAASQDGRFDLLLFVYNFMNKEAGERILAACKKNNVGATLMKTAPGVFDMPGTLDPDHVPEQAIQNITRRWKRRQKEDLSRAEAIERLLGMNRSEKENYRKTQDFMAKHGIKAQWRLRKASIQWVLRNPNMQSVCVSMANFDGIDSHAVLSGAPLAYADEALLGDYARAFSNEYCRHGCNECWSNCPYDVPVGTVMRYAYYFSQGWEKDAMSQYRALGKQKAGQCLACHAPCEEACPYGVNVRAGLIRADSKLSLV